MRQTDLALAMAEREMDGAEVEHLPIPAVKLLRERVSSAIEHTLFYRRLYERYGPLPEDDDRFLDWFGHLPIVSKSQLQAAGPAELLNPSYSRSDLFSKPTSGSTGIPFVLMLDNTLANFRRWRFQRPHHRIVGTRPSELVFIFPWDFVARTPRQEHVMATVGVGTPESNGPAPERRPVDQPAPESPGPSFSSLPKKSRKTGRTSRKDAAPKQEFPVLDRPYTVNSRLAPDQLFATLSELEPTTLIGFASSIAALAHWMMLHDERLPSVRQVWTTSEVLAPDGARAIRQAMGCEPLVIYASNEFGFMAWQSEIEGPLLFESDRLHVESIERDGFQPAKTGGLARLVITDLLNDTMPLIRYDIADVARARDPIEVSDGWCCAAILDLQGKEADLLTPPDGRTVTTFQILGEIKDQLPNAQYRFIGVTGDRYVLQYRPGVGFDRERIEPTIAALEELLGPGVEIHAQQVDVIQREPSGKLRPLVNLQNVTEAHRHKLAERLGVGSLLPTTNRDIAVATVRRALTSVRPLNGQDRLDEEVELYADLAIDSLQFVRLVFELERELGREIDDEDLLDIELVTVGDLVTYVEQMLPIEI